MTEGLRVVAQLLARCRVDLLGEESEGTGVFQDSQQKCFGLLQFASENKGIHQPEGAQDEGALLAGKSIIAQVAIDHPVRSQMFERRS